MMIMVMVAVAVVAVMVMITILCVCLEALLGRAVTLLGRLRVLRRNVAS